MAPVERADDVGGIIGGDGGDSGDGEDGEDGGGDGGGGDGGGGNGNGDVDITDNIKNTFIVLYSLYISIQNFLTMEYINHLPIRYHHLNIQEVSRQ